MKKSSIKASFYVTCWRCRKFLHYRRPHNITTQKQEACVFGDEETAVFSAGGWGWTVVKEFRMGKPHYRAYCPLCQGHKGFP